ncbi:hypothetical protein F542_14550 [Bibersteinia trehalosi USDA-ARS-USMARC-188]|uniref:Domain amino terminal to FKBP-type peptidyl-prolyl isomerase n=4 Tax=Bibersteinia trehalosi TaxID=47735 RepID=A0A4V7IB29_BIBTR|nr:hypothetical protein [Bibersteinia trehalosi]AGH38029.1 hypothetical protein WQG_7500 [Bibersteinia trehalosi USDA-ARS-USMARC-192]AHG82171.1 hypothetical protein F542_14550 [Bibersteinia trehalosi USDA-ARS-USMARC-188]AHG84483.1 hypothetical protein F543_16210 [Bibersteinia trehalosi USDA-ARS-USMARC-189]OAQ15454.1 hypothetical protein F480_02670 [Bibersteinia trehalosi Y31]RRN02342.1 hypothetical protein EIM44_08110 [Bibersteinia trehalosi]
MKRVMKSCFLVGVGIWLAGCYSSSNSWNRMDPQQIDQKSYAIAYAGTAQAYEDRVNGSYDIDSYIRGVDDYFNNRNSLPIEQIRGSLMNRFLDHNIYAYYSGIIDANSFQSKANYLSPKCWKLIDTQSATQGIHDAMLDLQKGSVRNDNYIKQGADLILHECVEKVEEENKAAVQQKAK